VDGGGGTSNCYSYKEVGDKLPLREKSAAQNKVVRVRVEEEENDPNSPKLGKGIWTSKRKGGDLLTAIGQEEGRGRRGKEGVQPSEQSSTS